MAKIRKVSFFFRIFCVFWLGIVILLAVNSARYGLMGLVQSAPGESAGTDPSSSSQAEVYKGNEAAGLGPAETQEIQAPRATRVTSFSIGRGGVLIGDPGSPTMYLLSSLLSLAFTAVGLVILYRLFGLYERGEIFGKATVRCYRWIAIWLLTGWAVSNLAQFFRVAEAGKPVQMHFSLDELFFGGVVLWLVSWIMDEGRKVQEEQALTV